MSIRSSGRRTSLLKRWNARKWRDATTPKHKKHSIPAPRQQSNKISDLTAKPVSKYRHQAPPDLWAGEQFLISLPVPTDRRGASGDQAPRSNRDRRGIEHPPQVELSPKKPTAFRQPGQAPYRGHPGADDAGLREDSSGNKRSESCADSPIRQEATKPPDCARR